MHEVLNTHTLNIMHAYRFTYVKVYNHSYWNTYVEFISITYACKYIWFSLLYLSRMMVYNCCLLKLMNHYCCYWPTYGNYRCPAFVLAWGSNAYPWKSYLSTFIILVNFWQWSSKKSADCKIERPMILVKYLSQCFIKVCQEKMSGFVSDSI